MSASSNGAAAVSDTTSATPTAAAAAPSSASTSSSSFTPTKLTPNAANVTTGTMQTSDSYAMSAASHQLMPPGRLPLRQTRSVTRAEASGDWSATATYASGAAGGNAASFVSILVHNLSHSDLMMSIRPAESAGAAAMAAVTAAAGGPSTAIPPLPPALITRPKFNRFKQITGRLLTYVENHGVDGVEFPSPLAAATSSPSPSVDSPNPTIAASSDSSLSASPIGTQSPMRTTCPYGFRVKDGQVRFQDWDAFKLKDKDMATITDFRNSKSELVAVFFPMLAVLVPRWLNIVAGKNARRGIRDPHQTRKMLYLISGAGTPFNEGQDASGNSTKGVAKLAIHFLRQFYPQVEVNIIHSGAEIFHYDANVHFVQKELKPKIEEVRRELSERYYDRWPRYMHLATTLTDGASARIAAISSSLRHLKPDCLHMWHLKSFWHEYPNVSGKKSEEDVEFHEFDKLEMTPPTLVTETDANVKLLVKEMIAHKEEFERVRDNRDRFHELDSFWLRKSKQPVLSVLMVKKKGKAPKFYRGINVEVSMPTGSLCSERNAIGSALSSDPSLCRKDLRMIAVLALGLDPYSTTSTMPTNTPIPPSIVPLVSTGPYATNASPTRVPAHMSPRHPAFRRHSSAASSSSVTEMEMDGTSANGTDHTQLPASAASTKLQRERSLLQQQQQRKGAPPLSPALKGKEEDAPSSSTPRKRKNSSAAASPALGPTPAATPPIHSPRFTRRHSQPQSSSTSPSISSARNLVADLSKSTQPSSFAPDAPPLALPASPRGRGSKRVKRSDSGANGAAADFSPMPPLSPSPDPHHVVVSGRVDDAARAAYIQHEQDMIRHRDAALQSPRAIAMLSGNLAPNASYPLDRGLSETGSRTPSSVAPAQLPHPADERNPINPCGACNEWLKKIAEVNPDFKVVTFTATDCMTCFVKAVKF